MIQAAGLLGLALLLCSCHEGPRGSADGQRPVPVSYAALAEAHNARVDRISRVYADGSIELRWTDEDGRHFAPGNVDLWIEPPARTAIHISKGGERIMWLGSDGPTAWLFDFRSDPTVLHVVAAAEGGTSDLPFFPWTPGTCLASAGSPRCRRSGPSRASTRASTRIRSLGIRRGAP
ncbi:MAG: hypothetical protein ACYSUA_09660 [Planctomycetota bacterium]